MSGTSVSSRVLASAAMGALFVGAVGFCAGFFGPMALNPSANQGPLVGIFIPGPGGAVLGAVVGALLGIIGVSPASCVAALAPTAALLAGATLFFALPEPEFKGNVLDLRVESCASPLELKAEAFAYWDARIASAPWAAVRPGWKANFEAMAAGDPRVSKAWPAEVLPNFLDLQVLTPANSERAALLR